jgi:hypothetical protein
MTCTKIEGAELDRPAGAVQQARSQERATIAILNTGAMHDSVHQQTLGVDENAASAPSVARLARSASLMPSALRLE